MTLPALTTEQRAAALQRAAEARAIRAEVKRGLKAGEIGLGAVLERGATDDAVRRMRVSDLLMALPGVGPRRAHQVMEHLGIAVTRRVRGLGVRQKAGLLDQFGAP